MKLVECGNPNCRRQMQARFFARTKCKFCGYVREPLRLYPRRIAAIVSSAAVVAVIAMASLVFQVGKDLGYVESIKSPDICFSGELGIEKISKEYPDDAAYLALFTDALDGSEDRLLANDCATLVTLTNNFDKEIQLESIRFEATDVEPDLSPCIMASLTTDGFENVLMHVFNTEWSAIDGMTIDCISSDGSLQECFGTDRVKIDVPYIEPGGMELVQFLGQDDIVKYEEQRSFIFDEIEAHTGAGNEVAIDDTELLFGFMNGGYTTYGKGGNSRSVYGIGIDTSEKECVYEEAISESVRPSESITVPICFFPDKSCDLRVQVSFVVSKGSEKQTVSTESVPVHFKVSSLRQPSPENDLTNPGSSLDSIRPSDSNAFSFPFSYNSWTTIG